MKKLILIVLALVTIQVSAQNRTQGERKGERTEKGQRMSDFTPEEMAQLQTKKMTLHLDLTQSQQKQIEKLNLENAKERKAKMEARQAQMRDGKGEKPSKEERLKIMNERLDKQIEMKGKLKKILTEDQLEKWEKSHAQKRRAGKNKKGKGNRK
jgi:hypothetical protein